MPVSQCGHRGQLLCDGYRFRLPSPRWLWLTWRGVRLAWTAFCANTICRCSGQRLIWTRRGMLTVSGTHKQVPQARKRLSLARQNQSWIYSQVFSIPSEVESPQVLRSIDVGHCRRMKTGLCSLIFHPMLDLKRINYFIDYVMMKLTLQITWS